MKKFIVLSAAMLLPFLASAANLNSAFNINTNFPIAGGSATVSSTCGTAGANSTVNFALMQNGINTPLASTLSTDSSGAFSGNISFPVTTSAGLTTLVATCIRSGDIINSPILTFAMPAGTSFGLPAAVPTIGGVFNLSGACGNSNGVGSAQINLNKNGSNYSLGNVNLSTTGTFSSSIIIPSNITTGPATLEAICSNGNTFSSAINIDPAAVNSFAFSASPLPGVSTNISGSCTNVSNNANGTVSFSVVRNAGATTLSTSNNLTNGSGDFNSTVFFPATLGSEPATLIVTCPNGSTFSNVIMLGAATAAVNGNNTTPVGGVNAGAGPNDTPNYPLGAEFFLITGLLGASTVLGKKLYAQK